MACRGAEAWCIGADKATIVEGNKSPQGCLCSLITAMGFLCKQAVQYQGYLEFDGPLRRKVTGQAEAKCELLFVHPSRVHRIVRYWRFAMASGRWAKVVRVPPPFARVIPHKNAPERDSEI